MNEIELESYLAGMADYKDDKEAKQEAGDYYNRAYSYMYELSERLSSGEYHD